MHGLFPTRIETDRLRMERLHHDGIDLFELYEFLTSAAWQEAAAEHMPWFGFDRLDQVADFVDKAEAEWADRETARYLIRATDEEGALIGTTAFGPEWQTRRAGSGIVLSKAYWGEEYGLERASAFIEMTFETYDLDAFYTTCAAENEPSRRMIEKYMDRYGGRHEGLLRQHSSRPDGSVTDQHRFSITRPEYEAATADRETLDFELFW
jgi:ribosomal-protein-alanine N-acetyltransferase